MSKLVTKGVSLRFAEDSTKICNAKKVHYLFSTASVTHKQGLFIPKEIIFTLLQQCAEEKDVAAGRLVHLLMISNGLNSVAFLSDHLIRFFTCCGTLQEANFVFCEVAKPSIHTWHAIMSAHVTHGQSCRAIELYKKMQQDGIQPNKFIYLCVLKACSIKRSLIQGKLLHNNIIKSELDSDIIIGNTLIDMYGKCAGLEDASQVFDSLLTRDAVSWNAIIAGYVQHGHSDLAVELFEHMQQVGIRPTRATFLCILKACGTTGDIWQGRLIHDRIIGNELESYTTIGSALIDMYAKHGRLEDAHKVFDGLLDHNVVLWSVMITAYTENGHGLCAIKLFQQMKNVGIDPDKVIFLNLLKACIGIGALKPGQVIHDEIVRNGFESDMLIACTLVDMYAKIHCLEEACRVFDKMPDLDVVSWNAMIAGYAQHGHCLPALELFVKMKEQGIKADDLLVPCLSKACRSIETSEQAQVIHDHVSRSGLDSEVVFSSSLIAMYVNCGSLQEACKVFDKLPNCDIMSWNAMLAGHSQHGHGGIALQLFEKMQKQGVKPDKFSFPWILKACGSIGALEHGKLIHDQIIRCGFESDMIIGSLLIDMYGKCGSLDKALEVFERLPDQDLVSWGAMIEGYAQSGNYRFAGQCLQDMQLHSVMPDRVIFISLLSSCSHAGLVEEGLNHFQSMKEEHGIIPNVKNFTCMIDLLGRAGHLKEAEQFLDALPISPNAVMWKSLLNACKMYGNMELGRYCFEQAVQLDPDDAAVYMILSSLYSDAHIFKQVQNVQELKNHAGAWKKPGRALIEAQKDVHEFVVGKKCHLQSDDITVKSQTLHKVIKRKGYVPQLDLVLNPTCGKIIT